MAIVITIVAGHPIYDSVVFSLLGKMVYQPDLPLKLIVICLHPCASWNQPFIIKWPVAGVNWDQIQTNLLDPNHRIILEKIQNSVAQYPLDIFEGGMCL